MGRKKVDIAHYLSSGTIISRQIAAFDLLLSEHPDFKGEWQDIPSAVQLSYMRRIR